MGQHNFLERDLEAKIVSMVSVHCHEHCAPPRFGLLPCCRRFVQHGVGYCRSTLKQLWKCFSVSPLR